MLWYDQVTNLHPILIQILYAYVMCTHIVSTETLHSKIIYETLLDHIVHI